MKPYSTNNGQFPRDGQYVLGKVIGRPWIVDDSEQYNVFFRVVQFKKGRLASEITDGRYRSQDQCFNNQKPYMWDEFGSLSFFGQEIEEWWHLQEITK